jgi:hypothetical protein
MRMEGCGSEAMATLLGERRARALLAWELHGAGAPEEGFANLNEEGGGNGGLCSGVSCACPASLR